MRLPRVGTWILAAQLFGALQALGQGSYKVEPIGAPDPSLAKALLEALQPAGTRLVNDQGAAVCEVWLRKSVPTQQNPGGSGDILYASLSRGTLVGVLRFPKGGSDFRGQPIMAGYYTLRYALIPQDGNHMGVSAYRDFLLLGPVAADTQVEPPMTADALVNLSRKASATNHPAVLSLSPATETKMFPAVVRDDQGHWILEVKVQGKSAAGEQEFPMGIILVGKMEAG